MLKEFIELFAEKFLTSRKAWVGYQAYPVQASPIVLARGTTDLPSDTTLPVFTAPYDGYVSVHILGTEVKGISIECGSLRLWQGGINNIWAAGFLPVKKGDSFTIYFRYATATNNSPVVIFFPSAGSKA